MLHSVSAIAGRLDASTRLAQADDRPGRRNAALHRDNDHSTDLWSSRDSSVLEYHCFNESWRFQTVHPAV
jgi:hypothetical protein